MKVNLSKRQLVLVGVPVLGLIVGMLGYFILVAPQKSKANRLAASIAQLQAEIVASHHVAPPRPEAKAPVSAHATDLFRLTKAMPDTNDVPGLLLNLSKLARSSSVALKSFTPAAMVPLAQGYGAVPIAIIVDGKFANVSNFLERMRSQVASRNGKVHATGRLLIAKDVQFSTIDGGSIEATLSLDAFVYGVAPPVPVTTTTTTAD